MILTLSEPAKRDLRRAIGRQLMGRPLGRLLQIATIDCGIPEEELKMGGPPVDNVAIDEEGQITLGPPDSVVRRGGNRTVPVPGPQRPHHADAVLHRRLERADQLGHRLVDAAGPSTRS